MPEHLATPEQLADYLGIPVATLYQWRLRRTGPPSMKIGRHLRYRWADVDGWLTTREAS